jgi:hypothetical protein
LIVTLIVRQPQALAASRRRTQPERHLYYTRLRIPVILIMVFTMLEENAADSMTRWRFA